MTPDLATLFRPTGNAWLTDTRRELVIVKLLSLNGTMGQSEVVKALGNGTARAYLMQMAHEGKIEELVIGRRRFYRTLSHGGSMQPFQKSDRRRIHEAVLALKGRGAMDGESERLYQDFLEQTMGTLWCRYNGIPGNEAPDIGIFHLDFDTMAEAHDQLGGYDGLEHYEIDRESSDRVRRIDGELWEAPVSYSRQTPFAIALDVGAGLRWD